MKNSKSNQANANSNLHKPAGNKPRPEIRDNMDSRSHSKPENYKGDMGHKNEKPKQKK